MRFTKKTSSQSHSMRILFSVVVFFILGYFLVWLNKNTKSKEGFSVTDSSLDFLNKISDKAHSISERFTFFNEFTKALNNIPTKLMKMTIGWSSSED